MSENITWKKSTGYYENLNTDKNTTSKRHETPPYDTRTDGFNEYSGKFETNNVSVNLTIRQSDNYNNSGDRREFSEYALDVKTTTGSECQKTSFSSYEISRSSRTRLVNLFDHAEKSYEIQTEERKQKKKLENKTEEATYIADLFS